MELNSDLYTQILQLSKEGDQFVNMGRFDEAIKKYKCALELLPGSKYMWEASTWLYTALGDTYYLSCRYTQALDCLFETLKCPEGLGNPFVFLRLGECFYETKNSKGAQEYLLKAYIYAGEKIFEGEPEKYIKVIKEII